MTEDPHEVVVGKWKWVGAAIQSRVKVLITVDHLGMAVRLSRFLGLKSIVKRFQHAKGPQRGCVHGQHIDTSCPEIAFRRFGSGCHWERNSRIKQERSH